jgi:hypothetical protein
MKAFDGLIARLRALPRAARWALGAAAVVGVYFQIVEPTLVATKPQDAAAKPELKPEVLRAPPKRDDRGRIILPEDAFTVLAFKNVSVDQIIPFIAETTGKVVIPQPELLARRITVISDQRIKSADALDYVFFALQQNQIGVVETRDTITLRDLADVLKQDVPVIGPEERLAGRKDLGTIVEKVFRFKHAGVEGFADTLPDDLPDFAQKSIDPKTNQIAVIGNIALLQRIEHLAEAFDVPSAAGAHPSTPERSPVGKAKDRFNEVKNQGGGS